METNRYDHVQIRFRANYEGQERRGSLWVRKADTDTLRARMAQTPDFIDFIVGTDADTKEDAEMGGWSWRSWTHAAGQPDWPNWIGGIRVLIHAQW